MSRPPSPARTPSLWRIVTTPEMLSYFSHDLADYRSARRAQRGKRREAAAGRPVRKPGQEDGSDYATVAMRFSMIDATFDRTSGELVAGDRNVPAGDDGGLDLPPRPSRCGRGLAAFRDPAGLGSGRPLAIGFGARSDNGPPFSIVRLQHMPRLAGGKRNVNRLGGKFPSLRSQSLRERQVDTRHRFYAGPARSAAGTPDSASEALPRDDARVPVFTVAAMVFIEGQSAPVVVHSARPFAGRRPSGTRSRQTAALCPSSCRIAWSSISARTARTWNAASPGATAATSACSSSARSGPPPAGRFEARSLLSFRAADLVSASVSGRGSSHGAEQWRTACGRLHPRHRRLGARCGRRRCELRGGGVRAGGAGSAGLRRAPAGCGAGFRGLAADVEAAIAARGLERPVLVGHSMGGMVAQTMLRRRPDGYARRRARLHQPGFRQRRRRLPEEVRRRPRSARSMPARPWPISRPSWSSA